MQFFDGKRQYGSYLYNTKNDKVKEDMEKAFDNARFVRIYSHEMDQMIRIYFN